MDRVAIGLGSVFMHLKAEINWYRLFHELIEDFDADVLAERQTEALRAAGLPELSGQNGLKACKPCASAAINSGGQRGDRFESHDCPREFFQQSGDPQDEDRHPQGAARA